MSFGSTATGGFYPTYEHLKATDALDMAGLHTDGAFADFAKPLLWTDERDAGFINTFCQTCSTHHGPDSDSFGRCMANSYPHCLLPIADPYYLSSAENPSRSSQLLDQKVRRDSRGRLSASPDTDLSRNSSSPEKHSQTIARSIELRNEQSFLPVDLRHSYHFQEYPQYLDVYTDHDAIGPSLPFQQNWQFDTSRSTVSCTTSPPPSCDVGRQCSFSSDSVTYSSPTTPCSPRSRPHRSTPSRTTSQAKMSTLPRLSVNFNADGSQQIASDRRAGTDLAFPCLLAPYGCTSSFASKNEWKRHMRRQHLRFDLWRCDLCNGRDKWPNDFHRKDLFQQHLRRMHSSSIDANVTVRPSLQKPYKKPGYRMASIVGRCHTKVRDAPSHSRCHFCPAKFEGPGSWDTRVDHIFRHLDFMRREGLSPPAVVDWLIDPDFHDWLEEESSIVWHEGQWRLAELSKNTAPLTLRA